MVMSLLYGLGAKDILDPLGYAILTCQRCGTTGPFAVFHSTRKVTVFAVPTVSVREQMVIECKTCQQRFAVPPDMQSQFTSNLLSEQDVIARMRQIKTGATNMPARPADALTYYQILQVDVAADPEVIEAAFRRLALKYHPDKSTDPAASEKMRMLIEAKDVLGNPDKRRLYDQSLGIVQRPRGFRADEV